MDKDVKEMLLSASGLFIILALDVLLLFITSLNAVLGASLFVNEKQDMTFLICSAVSIGVAGICYWKIRYDLKLAKKFDEKWSGKND